MRITKEQGLAALGILLVICIVISARRRLAYRQGHWHKSLNASGDVPGYASGMTTSCPPGTTAIPGFAGGWFCIR